MSDQPGDEPTERQPHSPEPADDRRTSRRSFLRGAALGATAGVTIGLGGALVGDELSSDSSHRTHAAALDHVPFYGLHQAGIDTAPPAHLLFTAYDLTTTSVADVARLLRSWTAAGAALTRAQALAGDSGETLGLSSNLLTLTFGFGPGLFDARFGLGPQRPTGFAPLPAFATDRLEHAISGGDLMIQACANDPRTTFHAARQLDRLAHGIASIRWQQAGFGPAGVDHNTSTPRNLLGFKDGTANPEPDSAAFASAVWIPEADGPSWLAGGTYLCVRRIRTDLGAWDALTVADQQVVIGRVKATGAPLSGGSEFSPLRFGASGTGGTPAIPNDSHVRLASNVYNSGATMLRRGYSYDNPVISAGGRRDVGLLFLAYVRDIATQFVPIQRQLASHDRLNAFTTHIGSAAFAVPRGVESGGYIGESLLDRVTR